jgi:hypothetical protein
MGTRGVRRWGKLLEKLKDEAWSWLARVEERGGGKWEDGDGEKETESEQEDKEEEGKRVEKEDGKNDGKKRAVGEKTTAHTVQSIRKTAAPAKTKTATSKTTTKKRAAVESENEDEEGAVTGSQTKKSRLQ